MNVNETECKRNAACVEDAQCIRSSIWAGVYDKNVDDNYFTFLCRLFLISPAPFPPICASTSTKFPSFVEWFTHSTMLAHKFRRMFCSIFGEMTVDDFCSPNTPHSQHICVTRLQRQTNKSYTQPILHLHGIETINLYAHSENDNLLWLWQRILSLPPCNNSIETRKFGWSLFGSRTNWGQLYCVAVCAYKTNCMVITCAHYNYGLDRSAIKSASIVSALMIINKLIKCSSWWLFYQIFQATATNNEMDEFAFVERLKKLLWQTVKNLIYLITKRLI